MNAHARRLLAVAGQVLSLPRAGVDNGPTLVGIHGLERGGTNFVSAHLHYHPEVFCASEHELDWRLPLAAYLRERSVFRADGWQDKQSRTLRRIVFNKVQRSPRLWSPEADFPHGARFLFYFRNPIRIHLSRENFRRCHAPKWASWAGSEGNFIKLLEQLRSMLDWARSLATRFPCRVLSHEHLACCFEPQLDELYRFLEVAPEAALTADTFFRRCGKCGATLTRRSTGGAPWLQCLDCGRRVQGNGFFNPARRVDSAGVRDEGWKTAPDVDRLQALVTERLGREIARYYWQGAYEVNLPVVI